MADINSPVSDNANNITHPTSNLCGSDSSNSFEFMWEQAIKDVAVAKDSSGKFEAVIERIRQYIDEEEQKIAELRIDLDARRDAFHLERKARDDDKAALIKYSSELHAAFEMKDQKVKILRQAINQAWSAIVSAKIHAGMD